MNKFFKCFSFIILCGCEIDDLQLPSFEKQSFSYEQIMQQQNCLKEEIQKISTDSNYGLEILKKQGRKG